MKLKVLFLLCATWSLFCLNIFAQQNADALNPDEEIKKYEIRGVIDGEEPSVSVYYEETQLGWMKPGQKKGNCLFKAYDKETNESVLEIGDKQYRLREGIKYVLEPDFEDEEIKVYAKKIDNGWDLAIHSKNDVFSFRKFTKITKKPHYNECELIRMNLYGASKMQWGEELTDVYDGYVIERHRARFGPCE